MPNEEKLRIKLKKYQDKLRKCRQHSDSRRKGSSESRSRSPVRDRQNVPALSTRSTPIEICDDEDNRKTRCNSSRVRDIGIPKNQTSEYRRVLGTPPQRSPLDITEDLMVPNVEIHEQEKDAHLLETYKELLGKKYEEPKKFEGTIHEDIAKCWQYILLSGLSKEEKVEMSNTYKIPQNCTLLEAPIMNAEVSAVLSENSKSRDKAIEYQQHQLGLATSIIGEVMTKLIENENTDIKMFKLLSDATKLLNDLNQQHTKTRRVLISPLLDKKFNQMIEKTNRDEFLYGENLSDLIKTSKQVLQSSASIQLKKAAPKQNITHVKAKTFLNKNGPPRQQYQPTRTMARGGPRGRGSQPSIQQQRRHAPTQLDRNSQRCAYYSYRR